jgi:hypothetical protein
MDERLLLERAPQPIGHTVLYADFSALYSVASGFSRTPGRPGARRV